MIRKTDIFHDAIVQYDNFLYHIKGYFDNHIVLDTMKIVGFHEVMPYLISEKLLEQVQKLFDDADSAMNFEKVDKLDEQSWFVNIINGNYDCKAKVTYVHELQRLLMTVDKKNIDLKMLIFFNYV